MWTWVEIKAEYNVIWNEPDFAEGTDRICLILTEHELLGEYAPSKAHPLYLLSSGHVGLPPRIRLLCFLSDKC